MSTSSDCSAVYQPFAVHSATSFAGGAPEDVETPHVRERNRLLQLLPGEEYARLLPYFETVSLTVRQALYTRNVPVPYVYFPQAGIISLVKVMDDGSRIEVGTCGNEGMAGLPVFLGGGSIPAECYVQVVGSAKRMSAAAFRDVVTPGSPLHNVLQRYVQALFNQVMQAVACNRLHSIEERCARWLLMAHDRVGADEFPLTHAFLAMMLGVRRAGVTVAEGMLRRAGFIRYSRGKVKIIDRAGLEAASCECYRAACADFDRLLGLSKATDRGEPAGRTPSAALYRPAAGGGARTRR